MRRLPFFAGMVLTVAAIAMDARAAEPPPAPRVLAWPEILVSRDRTLPHYEMMIAAHPKDPHALLGISITRAGRNQGSSACRTFASLDGGATWTASDLPRQIDRGGIDPVLAFDGEGTAWAVVLGGAAQPAKNGRSDALLIYRSSDGGHSWTEPVAVGVGETHDAPSIAVDDSPGPFHGRVYVATYYGEEEPRSAVLRSADGGRTFLGPVDLPGGGEGKLCMHEPPLVLRDGTLFVPVSCLDNRPESYAGTGRRTIRSAFTTSVDGGLTFAPLVWTSLAEEEDQASLWEIHSQRFVVDPGSPRFGGRMYAVWGDYRWGAPRTVLAASSDSGKSWSEPRAIDPGAPAAARQFQATVAIGAGGVVGITLVRHPLHRRRGLRRDVRRLARRRRHLHRAGPPLRGLLALRCTWEPRRQPDRSPVERGAPPFRFCGREPLAGGRGLPGPRRRRGRIVPSLLGRCAKRHLPDHDRPRPRPGARRRAGAGGPAESRRGRGHRPSRPAVRPRELRRRHPHRPVPHPDSQPLRRADLRAAPHRDRELPQEQLLLPLHPRRRAHHTRRRERQDRPRRADRLHAGARSLRSSRARGGFGRRRPQASLCSP